MKRETLLAKLTFREKQEPLLLQTEERERERDLDYSN